MSAPPYDLFYTDEANKVLDDMEQGLEHAAKLTKVNKALDQLRDAGPRYPALKSHPYKSVPGPRGETLWESYVENRTPSAWRIWWVYGPEADQITIITIGPHP